MAILSTVHLCLLILVLGAAFDQTWLISEAATCSVGAGCQLPRITSPLDKSGTNRSSHTSAAGYLHEASNQSLGVAEEQAYQLTSTSPTASNISRAVSDAGAAKAADVADTRSRDLLMLQRASMLLRAGINTQQTSLGGARNSSDVSMGMANQGHPCCNSSAPGQQTPSLLPLRTQGRLILDANGRRVRLRCASWSGAQERWYVPGGLWAQHRNVIAGMAKKAGLNCIRLVWSLEMVMKSANGVADVPKHALTANPDLVGRDPLQVLDAVIKAIAEQDLMVIIDNHSSDAIWCCGLQDGNGMWYTENWSEEQWLAGWSLMAKRYANVSAVVGVGLRNEPRPTFVGGMLRIPMWGYGGPNLDMALAYEKAAAQVLAARPTYLVFAQGLMAGRDLRLVKVRPLVLRKQWPQGEVVKGQLVYEVHEYPFLWGAFNFTDYDAYAAKLDEAWGYISRTNMAPIWLGEFGTVHNATGLNSTWWPAVTRFIKEYDLDWSYWPLDGQQGPSRKVGTEETYGLLNTTWNGWANVTLLHDLQNLM